MKLGLHVWSRPNEKEDKPRLALNNITAGVRERADANRTREAGHLDEIQGYADLYTCAQQARHRREKPTGLSGDRRPEGFGRNLTEGLSPIRLRVASWAQNLQIQELIIDARSYRS
jgi:hypothetical protein